MMSRLRLALVTAVLAGSMAGVAEAQTNRAHLGPRIGYNFDVEEIALGAQFSAPLGDRFEFYPSLDYYFVDPGSLWGFNLDLKYRFSGESLDWAYIGGGLNILTADGYGTDDSEAGLNLFFGIESLKGWVHPFGEGRAILSDNSSFQIAAGLNFTLGQH